MLIEISVKNFALINDINIKLDKGLNIIMGETGSGKSNLIDSISILLGDRAQKDKIRKGSDSAYITGAFNISNNPKLIKYLSSLGLYIEDEPLIISREISNKSNTITRINNNIASVAQVKEISKFLVDVYGQFENITILSKSEQRKFIDSLGNFKHKKLLDDYFILYNKYLELKEEIKIFEKPPEQSKRDLDFLKFQIDDIESSGVLEINESELEQKLDLIENSQELKNDTTTVINLLQYSEDSIITNLGRVSTLSERIKEIDSNFGEISTRLNQVLIETEDINREIDSYFYSLDFDEVEYKQLDNKRNILFESKRKYGNSIDEIEKYLIKSKSDLDNILNYESILKDKYSNLNKYEEELIVLAKEISENRKSLSNIFTEKIIDQLNELEMHDAKFDILFKKTDLSITGIDDVVFYVSFNKNEPLKELSSVASGGEISRFMLAIKSIEADNVKIPTIIFDEIDTGISGNAGNIVGNKLLNLSKNHQLICISHLPQIIAKGDTQFLVYKKLINDQVASNIIKLDYNERIEELAKVIEGDDYSKHTFNTAKNMIDDNKRG